MKEVTLMAKRILIFFSTFIAICLLASVGGVWFLTQTLTQTAPIPVETLRATLADAGVSDPDAIIASGSSLLVDSPYGYQLDVTILPTEHEDTSNFVILNHDFGENKTASLAYYQFFHDFGFNVVVYSMRNHGESGTAATTYGEFEKYDLQAIVGAVLAKTPDAIIGLHGVGLGGATVLEYAQIAGLEIDFYIAQGAFQDATSLLEFELNQKYPLLNWLPITPLIDSWLQISQGYALADASPLQAVSEIPQPVLFIYGSEDPYLPFGEALHARIPDAFGDFYLVEDADASNVYTSNPEQYKAVIKAFIAERFD